MEDSGGGVDSIIGLGDRESFLDAGAFNYPWHNHFLMAHPTMAKAHSTMVCDEHDVSLLIQAFLFQEINHAADLDITREIIAERYPEYLEAFDATMKSTKGHRFNMLVMKRPLLDRYCNWLFDILFELEKRLDISDYSAYDRRVFGFVGERLLDVWIRANDIPYVEPTKIIRFLKRKFLPRPQ